MWSKQKEGEGRRVGGGSGENKSHSRDEMIAHGSHENKLPKDKKNDLSMAGRGGGWGARGVSSIRYYSIL